MAADGKPGLRDLAAAAAAAARGKLGGRRKDDDVYLITRIPRPTPAGERQRYGGGPGIGGPGYIYLADDDSIAQAPAQAENVIEFAAEVDRV